MEVRKLKLPLFNQTKVSDEEEEDINRILNSSKNIKGVSIEKSLDWLNFFFEDPEIKDLFMQNERTKSLITIQCIYYLNIFRSLHLAKYKNGKVNFI